jgi:hypothetical protein
LQHHLVMPQSLAAFDEAEIPDQAVLAAAHSSEPAIRKTPHAPENALRGDSVNS